MFLFFYPVDNAREFGRHFFDGMKPEEAAKILLDLKDEGECVPYYYMGNDYPNGRFLNMQDFVENYNDQDVDGEGFWSVIIDIPYKKMRELVYGKDWFTNGIYPNETLNAKEYQKFYGHSPDTQK